MSPVFVLTNFLRDFSFGTVSTARNFGVKEAGKVAAGAIKAIPAIVKAQRTHNWNGGSWVYEKAYNDFREAGGAHSVVSQMRIDHQHQRLMDSYNAYRGAIATDPKTWSRPALRMVNSAMDLLLDLNAGVEQSMRTSAFKAAIERGQTPTQAAEVAASITVDFSRRGKWAPHLGALYLFYNPAVQGAINTVKLMKGKRGAAVMSSLVSVGILTALAGGATGDDDERYWDAPNLDNVKHRNLVFFGKDGTRYTIPLPYGMGFFVNLGYALVDLGRGQPLSKVGKFMLGSITQHFSPLGNPTNPVTFVAPTILDPVGVISGETREDGKPLLPKDWSGHTPDSERYWTSTRGTWQQRLTSWLNENTGGNSSASGLIDVSPETLNYLMSYLTGGAGTFIRDAVTAVDLTLETDGDTAVQKNAIPFLKNFYRKDDGRGAQSSFYEKVGQIEAAIKEVKEQADNPKARLDALYGIASLGSALNSYKEALAGLKKQQIDIIDSDMPRREKEEAFKELDAARKELYASFNQLFNEVK
jgi:hypothetical protein